MVVPPAGSTPLPQRRNERRNGSCCCARNGNTLVLSGSRRDKISNPSKCQSDSLCQRDLARSSHAGRPRRGWHGMTGWAGVCASVCACVRVCGRRRARCTVAAHPAAFCAALHVCSIVSMACWGSLVCQTSASEPERIGDPSRPKEVPARAFLVCAAPLLFSPLSLFPPPHPNPITPSSSSSLDIIVNR